MIPTSSHLMEGYDSHLWCLTMVMMMVTQLNMVMVRHKVCRFVVPSYPPCIYSSRVNGFLDKWEQPQIHPKWRFDGKSLAFNGEAYSMLMHLDEPRSWMRPGTVGTCWTGMGSHCSPPWDWPCGEFSAWAPGVVRVHLVNQDGVANDRTTQGIPTKHEPWESLMPPVFWSIRIISIIISFMM